MDTDIIDLTHECAKEPIHIPGSIQSHGFLITINALTFEILQASENIQDFLGIKAAGISNYKLPDLPAAGLSELFSLYKLHGSFESLNPFKIKIKDGDHFKSYNVISHASGDCIIMEFEPAATEQEVVNNTTIFSSIISLLSMPGKLENILAKIVFQVKELIGYDKIMIYRFAEDWHGEVIAEAVNDGDNNRYMGLHFPASDIPQQARDLYVKNVVRIIADVASNVSYLHPVLVNKKPVDLSDSVLRAVSPVHIQYLKNMGLGASFSISIVIDGILWGLIACHSYKPKFIPYEVRQTCKLVSILLSTFIKNAAEAEEASYKSAMLRNESLLIENIQQHWNIPLGLCKKDLNLNSVTASRGAAFYFNNEVHLVGNTPTKEQVIDIINWLENQYDKNFFFQTVTLPLLYPEAKAFSDKASGLMSICLSPYLKEYILWFKPELIKTVTWGGDPNKKVQVDDSGKLNPRHSFEHWSEQVLYTASPWKNADISVALKLKEDLNEIISFQANEIRKLNEKLLVANTELDAFSYTVSHDLKSPLTSIQSYAQVFLEVYRDRLDEDGKMFINKIIGGSKKMDQMINDILTYTKSTRGVLIKSPVEIKPVVWDIIEDIIINYNIPVSAFTIKDTPQVFGDKTMMKQIFQNIITNAVKYSKSPGKEVMVEINGTVREDNTVYSIRDNGIGIDMKNASKVFEIFARLNTIDNYEGHGVGLSIVKRLVERHEGKIWLESEPGKGATFYVSFTNN